MQLTKLKTLMEASKDGNLKKVTAMAWSPNNQRLAVVTVDRTVHLYNEIGERREKFATKTAVKGAPKNYVVRALAFSPDSTKLAVAQSDNIVYVYKLGTQWGGKISICNKFPQSCPVTCMTWPSGQPNGVVFGLADGKVKIGQLRNNSPVTLYSTDSYAVSLCTGPEGKAILSGHMDGSIYRFHFEDAAGGSAYSKFTHFSCPPYALAWGAAVVASGNDQQVVFYDGNGSEIRRFDYASDKDVKEFTVAECNPSGQSIVLGNFDKFFIYSFDSNSQTWEDVGAKVIPNYYSVTCLAWKQDGSRLTVGTLCGCVDLYDACIKRRRYKNTFEFTYVSPSQVIVKRINTGQRIVLKSIFGCEIFKINIYSENRYLVGNTRETLLCGDLESCKLSEVPWNSTGNEKFVFDNPNICMVYSSGELSLIEYGRNEILASCRTEHMRSTLVSVRINERPPKRTENMNMNTTTVTTVSTTIIQKTTKQPEATVIDNKKIAYLLDQLTIHVMDLTTGYSDATINHDSKIDWLELNSRADLLLYRDKRRQLQLYNIVKQSRTTLLPYCNYVQWVPGSDVVVAQNRGNLCVWYNIEAPEKVTIIPIAGDVEEIERVDGKTEVRVDEGMNTVVYGLDEALIGFGSALEDGNLGKAMKVLELQCKGLLPGEMRPETETMWKQLSDVALEYGKLNIAERCLSAIGDVSKARYLRKVNKVSMQICKETDTSEGQNHWLVRARLAKLKGTFRDAELIFLEHGQTEDAVEMYQTLHQWDEAIRVAEERNYPQAAEMKTNYFEYLLTSGQEEKAASIKENKGEYIEAIDLYLRGGRPAKAMHVVNTYKRNYKSDILEKIAQALTANKMHGKAGEFYERMNQSERALEAYIKGQTYRNAVELARREFPAQVVRLEEAWGDWLVQNKNMEAAISHYIEAGVSKKAIEAALSARQWAKAGSLVDSLQSSDEKLACQFYKRIARHYRQAQQFKEAEKYYVYARCEKEAIQMYTDAGQWETAHRLASRYMSSQEVNTLYTQEAQALEAKGKFKEAEKLLLTVNAVDTAISMYKKARKYDQYLRLVAAYRKDLLDDTLLHLAQQLEMEGKLKEAEDYYARAKDWQSAVNMYTANDRWDEAIRVSKTYGGMQACIKVAYIWARELGGEAGAKLLTKLGLIEQAIDYAIESSLFDEALQLAQNSLPSRVPEVHLTYALLLEDEDRYQEAEAEFIKAGKPKEAIGMYNHQQDWANAIRVAEKYEPSAISDILVAQAKVAVENNQYANAESLFLNAKRPELVLEMYQKLNMWTEAMKFAKTHAPHKLQDINNAYQISLASAASQQAQKTSVIPDSQPISESKYGDRERISPKNNNKLPNSASAKNVRTTLESAKVFEDSHDYARALDSYLQLTIEDARASSTPKEDSVLVEKGWESAIRVASQHVKERYDDVVDLIAGRLEDISRFNAAAELYREIDQNENAINCFLKAKNFPKAQEVAQIAPAFEQMVDKAYKEYLKKERNPNALQELGDFDSAVNVHAEQGDWEKAFELIKEKAPDLGGKYAGRYAGKLLKDSEIGSVAAASIDQAIEKLATYGPPNGSQNFGLFCRLSQEVLGRDKDSIEGGEPEKGTQNYLETLRNLREILFNVCKQPTRGSRNMESKTSESKLDTIERLLLIVHLYLYMFICKENGMEEMSCNIAVTLLRFVGDIPADKVYYLAGNLCKEIEWLDKAFVFLNRYIDLSEAIVENDMGMLVDNSDFAETDIPFDHPLPGWNYLDDESQEEVRDWVLGSAMKMDVEQEPITMEWLQDVRSEVWQQLGHVIRRLDRGALPIEEYLVQVRQTLNL